MKNRSPDYRFVNDLGFNDQTVLCPWCNTMTGVENLSRINLKPEIKYGDEYYSNLHIGKCRSCEHPFIGLHHKNGKEMSHYRYVYPKEIYTANYPDTADANITKIYKEACEIVHISPMAAAVLARRCVQQLLRQELQISKRTLYQEIKIAITREELSLQTRKMLEYVRHVGNWSAHPEVIVTDNNSDTGESDAEQDCVDPGITIYDTSREEALATIKVVESMFDDLYTKPAESDELWEKLREVNPNLQK